MHISPSELCAFWAQQHQFQEDIDTAIACLDEMEKQLPLPAKKIEKAQFLHMAGTPGSGKSTIANILYIDEKVSARIFRLGFDRIMEALPPYKEDLKTHGREMAFKRWEIPARAAGYMLLQRMLDRKISVLFDHTASDSKHMAMLLGIRSKGYDVFMVYPQVSLETALRNVNERMKQPGSRHTPEEMVRQRYELISWGYSS